MKNYITLFGILFLFIISIVVATECQDSDGDDTGHIKGSCSSPYDVTQTDFCDSESRVVEFYCDSQEDRCMATTYNCEEGYCYDGICVTQSEYDRLKNEEETRGFVKEICTENDETVERSDLINECALKYNGANLIGEYTTSRSGKSTIYFCVNEKITIEEQDENARCRKNETKCKYGLIAGNLYVAADIQPEEGYFMFYKEGLYSHGLEGRYQKGDKLCIYDYKREVEQINITNEPIKNEIIIKQEPQIIIENKSCQGCLLNEDCIIYETILNNQFCDSSGQLIPQKESGDYCKDNYECKSNI